MKLLFSCFLLLVALCAPAHAARTYPVDGPITSGIGWRVDPFGSGRLKYHSGIDISVPVGTPVHPTQQGYVIYAGPFGAYGNTVAIAHAEGYTSLYGHNSELLVKVGQWVDCDTVIARSGSSGRSTGPHVHYEVRRAKGRDLANQEQLVNEMRERLEKEYAEEVKAPVVKGNGQGG